MSGNSVNHFIGNDLPGGVTGHHLNIGLGIKRITLIDQFLQHLRRIGIVKQRTVLPSADAFQQCIKIRIEPDRYTIASDSAPGLLIHEGPASGGDHLRPGFQQTADHSTLQRTEFRLTVTFKQIRDRHTRGRLDLMIAVDKLQPKQLRDTPPDCGLACTHQADKYQAAFSQPAQYVGRFTFSVGRCRFHRRMHAPLVSGVSAQNTGAVKRLVVLLGALAMLRGASHNVPEIGRHFIRGATDSTMQRSGFFLGRHRAVEPDSCVAFLVLRSIANQHRLDGLTTIVYC